MARCLGEDALYLGLNRDSYSGVSGANILVTRDCTCGLDQTFMGFYNMKVSKDIKHMECHLPI